VRTDTSWLCPTPNHRERFFDMQPRLRAARLFTMAALSATAVSLMDRGGWPLLVVAIVNLIGTAIGASRLQQRRRPELWVFFGTLVNLQVAIAAAALLTGGPRTPIPALLAIPVLGMAARFSNRGLMVGAPISLALVVLTTLGADPAYVIANPETLAPIDDGATLEGPALLALALFVEKTRLIDNVVLGQDPPPRGSQT